MTTFSNVALFVIATLFTQCSCESNAKVDPTSKHVDEKRRVNIRFSHGAGTMETLTSSLFEMEDATIHHQFESLRTVSVTMSQSSIKMLAKEPYVELIEDDGYVYPLQDYNRHRFLAEEVIPYGVNMVQAPQAWAAGHIGEGITVCIIDSGIDADHEDLVDVPKTGFSFTDEDWFVDTCDHGTHVAGTVAATRDNGVGVVGVAPGVDLVIIDVFQGIGGGDCDGTSESTVVAAAEMCEEMGADVINMSLGGGGASELGREGFAAVRSAGVILFASAGNSGTTATSYPAGYESVISVAAIDENRDLAFFSQRNEDVELAGPGVSVYSTINADLYANFSGTSMSCPHATAVGALTWSSLTTATPGEVIESLRQTAEDLGAPGRDNSFGYGLVQAFDAISLLPTVTASPTVAPTTGAPTVSAAPTPGPAENDLCIDAEPIQIGVAVEGDTARAQSDAVDFCGTSYDGANGVWYSLTGTGSILEVNTCATTGYDTKIFVYEGDCDNLVCVDGNDDSCGFQSAVSWESEADVEYLILVHGFALDNGPFVLIVNEIVVPDNDLCDDAATLGLNTPVEGITLGSTFDNVGECGTSNTVGGVWYSVTGDGSALQANTCSGTFYDSKISVFTGSCEELVCVDGNDDFCRLQSGVNWQSESGVEYLVLVHGFASSQGSFELIVTSNNTDVPTSAPTTGAPTTSSVPSASPSESPTSQPGSVQQSLIALGVLLTIEFISAMVGLIIAVSVLCT